MQFAIMSDGGVQQLKKKMTCVWAVLQQRIDDLEAYVVKLRDAAKQPAGTKWPRAPSVVTAARRAALDWVKIHGLQYPDPPSVSSLRRHFTRWAKTGEFKVERPGPKSGQQW